MSLPELVNSNALGYSNAARDDVGLGVEVNARLVSWAQRTGIYPGGLDRLEAFDVGRLVMLVFPGTDDVGRLLVAARWMATSAALDDGCAGGEGSGSSVVLQQIADAQAALGTFVVPDCHMFPPGAAARKCPAYRAVSSALEHLATVANREQLRRIQQEVTHLLLAKAVKTEWRACGTRPLVQDYLLNRRFNGFLPWMTFADVIHGYSVPQKSFERTEFQRLLMLANMAAVLVNDLYSMSKGVSSGEDDYHLPSVLAGETGCTPDQAVERTIEMHNDLLARFRRTTGLLERHRSPAVRRFATDLGWWLVGSAMWHSQSQRYRHGTDEGGWPRVPDCVPTAQIPFPAR